MTSTDPVAPLLSRPVALHEVPEAGLPVVLTADPEERARLCALNKLVDLPFLEARLLVRHEGRSGAVVSGTVRARVVQTCVVSLDPFESAVDEPVEVHFLGAEALATWRAAHARRPDDPEQPEEDEPDLIDHGTIDLGVLAAEYLTLGLDPYPRKPGVDFDSVAPTPPARDESPFAVLRALRDKA